MQVTDKSVKKEFFSVNCHFNNDMLYHALKEGTYERKEMMKLAKTYGISSLRFPGGTYANIYVWNDSDATKQIRAAKPDPRLGDMGNDWYSVDYFVCLEEFLRFCVEAEIEPIVGLNMYSYVDQNGVHLLAPRLERNDAVGLLDQDKYYDGNYLDAAADKVRELVQWVNAQNFRVRFWEMGNEEYGYPAICPRRYGELVKRYTDEIKRIDPDAEVLVTLGSWQEFSEGEKGELDPLLAEVRSKTEGGDPAVLEKIGQWEKWPLDLIMELRGYEDVIDQFTLHYAWTRHVNRSKNFLFKYGFQKQKIAVTEFHAVSKDDISYVPVLSRYLIEMLKNPHVDIAVNHDLVSEPFGVFHYREGQIIKTPAVGVYQVFRELVGGYVINDSEFGSNGVLVKYCNGTVAGVFLNDSESAVEYTVDLANMGTVYEQVEICEIPFDKVQSLSQVEIVGERDVLESGQWTHGFSSNTLTIIRIR